MVRQARVELWFIYALYHVTSGRVNVEAEGRKVLFFLYNNIDTPRLIYLSVERMVTYMDLGMVAMIQGI